MDGDFEGHLCGLHRGVVAEGGNDLGDRGPRQEGGEVSGCLGRGTTGANCPVCPVTTSPIHSANTSLRSRVAGDLPASQGKENDPFPNHSPGKGAISGAHGLKFVLAPGGRSDPFAAPFPVGPLQVVVGPPPTIGASNPGTAWLVALPKPQLHGLGGF